MLASAYRDVTRRPTIHPTGTRISLPFMLDMGFAYAVVQDEVPILNL
jgi:hypothetical protein